MRLEAVALDREAESSFAHGAPRAAVEQAVGPPDSARALPDGSTLATYTYTLRNPEWRSMKWQWAAGTVITLGTTEAAWVPWAAWEARRARRHATFVYDADGSVIGHAGLPRYGPPDESTAALSFVEIRERCRAEHDVSARAGYDRCVATRLAIWGVE